MHTTTLTANKTTPDRLVRGVAVLWLLAVCPTLDFSKETASALAMIAVCGWGVTVGIARKKETFGDVFSVMWCLWGAFMCASVACDIPPIIYVAMLGVFCCWAFPEEVGLKESGAR